MTLIKPSNFLGYNVEILQPPPIGWEAVYFSTSEISAAGYLQLKRTTDPLNEYRCYPKLAENPKEKA